MDDHDRARRLGQLFERLRGIEPTGVMLELKRLNLSISHMRALHLLAPGLPLPMKELAEQLQLAPPTVTALTRRLVQTGLVARSSHPDDSRSVLLHLTDAGRALQGTLHADHLQRMAWMLSGLTAAEQEQLLALWERAIAALQTENATHAASLAALADISSK